MSESQAVEAVVHLYVDAIAFANAAALRKVFHPKASIIGNYQQALEWLSVDDFVEAVLAETPLPAGRQPFMEIVSLDVSEDAAVVKVLDDFAGMRFTDYLSLVKCNGRWAIVSKLYHLHEG